MNMRRRFGLVLAVVLLGAAILPATTLAGGNIGRQGTKTAPVTVHCFWDASAGLYDVAWTVSPDLIVQMAGNEEAGFILWAAASSKASAPSEYIDDTGFSPFYSYYSDFDVWGPDWPAGYVRVQAVAFSIFGAQVLASGVAKCQNGSATVVN